MDLTFYFVAMVKRGEICYLRSGPFICSEDADKSFSEIASSELASGSCEWRVVKAEMSGEFTDYK